MLRVVGRKFSYCNEDESAGFSEQDNGAHPMR
jgi:hypothetical protein